MNISLGKRWLEEIHDALQTAQIEIILCSKESVQRPWINFECGAGWARNIPVVPVCHSGLEVDALPIPLKMLKGMQCNNPEGLEQLYALLAETFKSVMPRPDFSVVVKEVMAFEEQYQTRMGIDSITQMNVLEMPALLTQIAEFINHSRATNKLTEIIERATPKSAFNNSFQNKVATWRIMRTREEVQKIQQYEWELEAMTPEKYVAHMFGGIMDILERADEYCTITNFDFWSHKAVEDLEFLKKNMRAVQRGATVKRVFIIDRNQWSQKIKRAAFEKILREHKSACELVNNGSDGKMIVKCYLSDNYGSDRRKYGHFGFAFHSKGESGADDGCVVVVPRYEFNFEAISHIKLLFSQKRSNGNIAYELSHDRFVSQFEQAFSKSLDLDQFLDKGKAHHA